MKYEQVKKPRKPSRPRLEKSARTMIVGTVDDENDDYPIHVTDAGNGHQMILLSLRECVRLRKFLEKCEAYLSQRKAKRGGRGG